MTMDSGAWLPTPDYIYTPKLFDDPRGTSFDKENMPELEPIMTLKGKIFRQIDKLLKRDNKWEAHVAKLMPLPKTRSPNIDTDQLGSMEWLEATTDDDIDVRDFSERPANDKRPANLPENKR